MLTKRHGLWGTLLGAIALVAACGGGGGGSSSSSTSGSTSTSSGASGSSSVYLKCDCIELTGIGETLTFTTSNDKLIITGSNPTSVVHQTTGGVNETLNVPEGESVSTMATGGMYVNFFRGAKGVGEADYFIIMSDGDMSLSANIYQLYSYSTNTTWPSERVFVDFGRDVVSMDMQSGEFVFYHNTQNGQIQTGGGYSLAVNEGASSLSSYSDSFTQLVRTGNNTFVVVQTGSVSNTSDIYP